MDSVEVLKAPLPRSARNRLRLAQLTEDYGVPCQGDHHAVRHAQALPQAGRHHRNTGAVSQSQPIQGCYLPELTAPLVFPVPPDNYPVFKTSPSVNRVQATQGPDAWGSGPVRAPATPFKADATFSCISALFRRSSVTPIE